MNDLFIDESGALMSPTIMVLLYIFQLNLLIFSLYILVFKYLQMFYPFVGLIYLSLCTDLLCLFVLFPTLSDII